MRRVLTAIVALAGVALMIIGFLGAQPMTGQPTPQLLGGATIWILGIMLLFASPAVYCILPEREQR